MVSIVISCFSCNLAKSTIVARAAVRGDLTSNLGQWYQCKSKLPQYTMCMWHVFESVEVRAV
jgi:hypothetical protein